MINSEPSFLITRTRHGSDVGRRAGVAEVFGYQPSGFIAWWMWRTIYLNKLPRFKKKFRVALDWTLDLLFHKDLVQFQTLRTKGVSHKEAEPARSEKRVG
jgi:NADH dehydrogenase